MTKNHEIELSVVVPLFNEGAGLRQFHDDLLAGLELTGVKSCEVLYCDDGSTDDTAEVVRWLASKDSDIRLIKLSRNFGKENALTAGIAEASGKAILTVDGDGQQSVGIESKSVS